MESRYAYNLAYFGSNQLTECYVWISASIIVSQQHIACQICGGDWPES